MASKSQPDACSDDSFGNLDSLGGYLQKLQDELDQEMVSKDERHKFRASAIQRMIMDDADGDYNNVAVGGGDDFYRHSDGASDNGGARKGSENFSGVAEMCSLRLDMASPETRTTSNYESKGEIRNNYGTEETFHGGGNTPESISEYCLGGGSQPYYGQAESSHNEGTVNGGAVNYLSTEKYNDEGATSRGTGDYSQEDRFSREGGISGSTDSHNSEEIAYGCCDSRANSKVSGSALVSNANSKYFLGERFSTDRSPRSLLDTNSHWAGREGDNLWDPHTEVGERYQSSLLDLPNEVSEDGDSEVSDLIEFSDEEDQSTESEPQHRGSEASNSYITTGLVKTNVISGRGSPNLTSEVECASIVSSEESEDEHQESFMSRDVEQSGLDEDDNENEPLEFQELVKYLERRTLRRQIPETCSPIVRSLKVVVVEEEEIIQNDQTSQWLQMDQTNKIPKESPTTKVVASNEVRFGSTDCNTEDLEVEHTLGLQNFQTIPNIHNLDICATNTNTINYGINNPKPSEHEVTTTLGNIPLPDEIIQRSPEFEHLTVKAIANPNPLVQTGEYRVIPMTGPQRTYDRKARRARAKERSLAMLLRAKSQIRSSDTTSSSNTSIHTSSLESVKIHHNREIRIGNLPQFLTLKTILSKVRGGLLDRVSYRKSQHTVIIVFFDPDAASNFYQHILTFPLTYPTTNNPLAPQRFVNVFPFAQANIVGPNTLEIREAVSHGATRCIFLGFLPASIGIRKIQSDIMERFGAFQNDINWARTNDELIESIEVVPQPDRLKRAICSHFRETEGKGKFEGMSVIIRLSSINLAFEAIGYFGTLPAYFCVELAFVEDECAGPLERPAATMGGSNHRLGDNSLLHRVASVKPGYIQPGCFTIPSQPLIQKAHLFASINSRACQSSDASQPPDSNIVYLGNLPPNITFQTLARWIRGGNVDTIHLYSDTEYPTKEAVIFFVASKSARQYHNFIATHGMFIAGRKILALKYIPNHIKAAHNPLSFLRGYPRNGITRFVKIWDVRDPQQLLGCIVGFCDQGAAVEEMEDKITKGVRSSITIHFMGMRDALRTVYQLKRFDCYRGLRTAYVRDPCDGDVMELVRREGQRER